jgi:putative membrane protein
MMGWGMGFGIFGLLFMLLFWVILILAAVWLVRALFGNGRPRYSNHEPQSAREILDQRYARGEITREQYEMMKKDLE